MLSFLSKTKPQTKRTMTIEITKEAALKLIGNDEDTCRDYKQDELAESPRSITVAGVPIEIQSDS